MDLLRTGAAWLESQRKAYMSVALTYQRTGSSGFTITIPDATAGETKDEMLVTDGITTQSVRRDYIFAAAIMPIFPPSDGDVITELDGSTWEAYTRDPSGCWCWADIPNNTAIRVHVKQTGYASGP